MAILHPELKYQLSTFLPNFKQLCQDAAPCPNHPGICHITVVRLARDGFGKTYDYCPIHPQSHHVRAAVSTSNTLDQDELDSIWERLPRHKMKLWENKHLFVGAVPEWNRTREFNELLRVGRRVVVEVFWYYARGQGPASVPMIGAVMYDSIVIPLSQPITQQMFTCFNPWHPDGGHPLDIEVWSTCAKTWCPVPSLSISLHLEYNELPILRLPSGREPFGPRKQHQIIRLHPADNVALGRTWVTPMCSMKRQMYELQYIWPEYFRCPRSHYQSVWKVDRSSLDNAIQPYKEYAEVVVYKDGEDNEKALGILHVDQSDELSEGIGHGGREPQEGVEEGVMVLDSD